MTALKTIFSWIVPGILFISSTLSQVSYIGAQNPPLEVKNIPSLQTSGEVIRVGENSLIVHTPDGIKEVIVSPSIRISRDSSTATIGEIKPGDMVVVMQVENGEILSVDAVSKSVIEVGKWVAPALFGGLFTLLVVIWLLKRSQKVDSFLVA